MFDAEYSGSRINRGAHPQHRRLHVCTLDPSGVQLLRTTAVPVSRVYTSKILQHVPSAHRQDVPLCLHLDSTSHWHLATFQLLSGLRLEFDRRTIGPVPPTHAHSATKVESSTNCACLFSDSDARAPPASVFSSTSTKEVVLLFVSVASWKGDSVWLCTTRGCGWSASIDEDPSTWEPGVGDLMK
ncbi:unnamed protein product [Mycena citricolor]|uniref:Uncharacterized protein n=1 Tax=Mycena citricolor TaxID=2018698 RepID=A0AAD2HQH2_9AGAR|nr:unnamed protein product [Mycena citricolor]